MFKFKKEGKTCGCLAIAFCISLMFGDDSATLCYDQKEMRSHIIRCFEMKSFLPFPATLKKSRVLPPLEISLSS